MIANVLVLTVHLFAGKIRLVSSRVVYTNQYTCSWKERNTNRTLN